MHCSLPIGLVMAALVAPAMAQSPPPAGDIDALARKIAAGGSVQDRTGRLVAWINHDFEWTATDYRQRTPEQIIDRRAGNCADLSKVLARLLDGVGIRHRVVREINLQPASDSRQSSAERKIATGGARFSVFGRRHNDHTWLEVHDPDLAVWIPADPAVGVVGVADWIAARLAFADRRHPAVAATVPIVQAMLVPFAVLAGAEDRSPRYLIDQFDGAYGGRLRSLPGWDAWRSAVGELGPLSRRAFDGEENLHQHASAIARAADAYGTLRQQAAAAGLTLK